MIWSADICRDGGSYGFWFDSWPSTRVTIFVGDIVRFGTIILIAKRSQIVAGGCSEAETPGTESNW